ncbi:MAG: cell division protein FtsZ [Saprospiraceae bacterium]|nr:cell division protein FtsZ [Saprospiraceae bacterium]
MVFNFKQEEPSIIKVIGVGGGGSNAVTHMYKQGIIGVDFAICNTDSQAMELSPVPTRIQLGPSVSAGLGAGSQPQRGKQACLESIEDVKRYLENGTKMLFITAGMGGGTGTGAAPIIAKTAQEMGILTVAIVTLPFTFEGKKRVTQGVDGLEELKKNVDTIIVISNDKLRQIYGNMSVSHAFAQADNILTTAAKGIAEIITVPGYVNVDFEDVNTVMRGSGVAIMGIGVAEGENRALKAVDAALSSPLLEDNNIQGAKHILVNITSGTKEVTMDEIFGVTEFVQEEAGEGANLIWGNCYDDTLGDKVAVTVIATGFESRMSPNAQQGRNDGKIVVSLDEEPKKDKKPDFFGFGFENTEGSNSVIEFESERFSKPKSPAFNFNQAPAQMPQPAKVETNEEDRRRKLVQEQARRERLRSSVNTLKLSNPQTIIEMENEPAYLRRGVKLDSVQYSSERMTSNWSIDENDELRTSGNSFLHDNVD